MQKGAIAAGRKKREKRIGKTREAQTGTSRDENVKRRVLQIVSLEKSRNPEKPSQ